MASASGMPTNTLSRNPRTMALVVTQPLVASSGIFWLIMMATWLGAGTNQFGILRRSTAISHRMINATSVAIGYTMPDMRAREDLFWRARCMRSSTISMSNGWSAAWVGTEAGSAGAAISLLQNRAKALSAL